MADFSTWLGLSRASMQSGDGTESGSGAEAKVPPNDLKALEVAEKYFSDQYELRQAVRAFRQAIPKQPVEEKLLTRGFKSVFLGQDPADQIFRLQEGLSPINVSLVALNTLFSDPDRFLAYDCTRLPYYDKLAIPYTPGETAYTPVQLGHNRLTVPHRVELWLKDKNTGTNLIVEYSMVSPMAIQIQIECGWMEAGCATDLLDEVKEIIFSSRYFRNQIVEMTHSGYHLVDFGGVTKPILDPALMAELEKNVINVFKKAPSFKKYELPAKRSILLEGSPGNGKTLAAKWLASQVKELATVVWTTAKSIEQPSDIARVFDLARRLAPCMLVLEDLDLITGTRDFHGPFLGEMLNQLDGIHSNTNIVVVASTNKARSLDEALRDRPGRFDRIYQIGKPGPAFAEEIAKHHLSKRGIPDDIIQSMNLGTITKGDLSGAQVAEVINGALFEAIHRDTEINDLCVAASYKGLSDQRSRFGTD